MAMQEMPAVRMFPERREGKGGGAGDGVDGVLVPHH